MKILIIIIVLIVLNGIFSMVEMSLVSSRKFKLESAKKKGNKGAKTALELSENPTKFLSTVQIGITLIGILLGVYSGENLTNNVELVLSHIEILAPYSHDIAVAFIVIVITYLSIVLGELFPKRLGMTFPESIAIFMSRPMKLLSLLTSPFVWLLTVSNDLILKVFGIKNSVESRVSEEEIKSIIKESAEGGEIQDIEQDIVERVFEFGDRKVNSLYTHKNDIVFLDETDDLFTVRQKISAEKHSAYPVCKENDIDKITGIVLLKDLFAASIEEDFDLKDYVKEPLYLTESTYAYKLLEKFKNERMHYGIIVDEYGSTQGIVTMDDVVDAIIGDVTEHNQDEYQITPRDENSWFVDGQYSFMEFLHYFDIEPDEEYSGDFVTIAGYFIHKLEILPDIGDTLIIDSYKLEIVDKDGQRIDKILVTKV
ncbi:MAG: hemolysin family protein [Paludibacter sp.]|nr:hemolysin family protein [Paludibacter sp.]